MSSIAISPGHYGVGTGAKDIIDEVAEARKVVDRVAYLLEKEGVKVYKIVDNRSKNQSQNLNYLISEHNSKSRSLDVSIHFNSSGKRTDQPLGTEVLYRDEALKTFAGKVSQAIANASGLKNRGAKKRTDLAFLNGTKKPAILIEVCFVNSLQDVIIYQSKFQEICEAIAKECLAFIAPNLEKEKSNLEQIEKEIQNNLPSIGNSNEQFTSPELKKRLEAILKDKKMIEVMIQKGISEQAINANWMEKLKNGSLSSADLLGLCTLIIEHQIKKCEKIMSIG